MLTALWWRALQGLGLSFRAALAGAIAISLAYAATDEFHQTFVEGRHGTPVDVLIDAAGMALAATVIVLRRLRAPAADLGPLAPAGRVGERLDRAGQPR